MKNPPFFRFGYSCPVRADTDPKPHQVRDGAAFCELAEALRQYGGPMDTLIFNRPYREGKGDKIFGPGHFTFLQPGHCIVQTTRPPLHDHATKNRKKIHRSCSHLENAVFSEIEPYFRWICRKRIELAPALVKRIALYQGLRPSAFTGRYEFRQTHDARIARSGRLDGSGKDFIAKPDDYKSLGFFLQVPAIRDYRCRLILSFGMGGFETLVWNRIVRMRYSEWLDEPRFVMAEMDLNFIPGDAQTLHYAETVPIRILINDPVATPEP